MKKTKVVCTLGPSCKNEEVIREMIYEGMNVSRINMSHESHEGAESVINTIRQINSEIGSNVAILIDTKGPEIRVGKLQGNEVYLEKGNDIYITTEEIEGNNEVFSVNYKGLINDVDINDLILLDDGLLTLKVNKKNDSILGATILNSGILKSNKSVNVPGRKLRIPFLSEKDKADIEFAHKIDADFLALSYVSDMEDVLRVKDMLTEWGNDHIQIISKIENSNAVSDITNIIRVSDGIMIARGDLGVEMPFEYVPGIQKTIINECHENEKVTIVATQMLDSMSHNNRPTRAEVTDVYNAVGNGADAIMLSGETASGNYPVEAVKTMTKIALQAENEMDCSKILDTRHEIEDDITAAIAESVVESSKKLRANAIVASTNSGYTARKVSNFRPRCPILATTPNEKTARRLALHFGVKAVTVPLFTTTDEIVQNAKEVARRTLKLNTNDIIIITGGFPLHGVKHTNFMKIVDLD